MLAPTMSEPKPLAAPAAPTSTPQANPRYYWEDFHVGSSREFGAMPVTREAVIAFARDFDPQPFHLDDAAASRSLFGKLAASGWHTCAMAMRIMCDDYLLQSSSLGSPGIDNLRWLAPVFPGDTLHMRLEVLAARPMNSRPGVGLVQSRWHLINQHDQPVMSMQGWGMFAMRTAPAASPA